MERKYTVEGAEWSRSYPGVMDASGGEKKNLSRIALKLVEQRCKCRKILRRSHI
jgi:hypothetical protein